MPSIATPLGLPCMYFVNVDMVTWCQCYHGYIGSCASHVSKLPKDSQLVFSIRIALRLLETGSKLFNVYLDHHCMGACVPKVI